MARGTLGEQFDSAPNALNFVRLMLATIVVVWHSHLLANREPLAEPVMQLLEQFPVDGFFAISGFLILRSWTRRPAALAYLWARCLRLFPGLWTCLLITAFVIMPLALHVAAREAVSPEQQVAYVLQNSSTFTWVDGRTMGDITAELHRNVINLSLWSLRWEVACYLGVFFLGVAGLLRLRLVVTIAAVAWGLAVSLMLLEVPDDFVFGPFPLPRLVLMFALGALAYHVRNRVPVNGSLAFVAATWIAAASLTPDYRVFAGPAVVYLLLWLGLALGRVPALRLEHDLSYGTYLYGAPVQQGLLIAGVTTGWASFTAVSLILALPLAALSWFLVERRAMRLKHVKAPWTRRTHPVTAAAVAGAERVA